MEQNLNLFGMGIRVLKKEEGESIDLGVLEALRGTWIGKPNNGWNVISVPGLPPDGFTLEVIPFEEKLTFTPVVAAGNRGPVINGVQQEQQLTGLMYEQIVTSTCETDFCKQRGFKSGEMIHGERGIFLNVKNFNDTFDIVRLATIPHGNSVLALGQSFTSVPKDDSFIGTASTLPTKLDGSHILGYGEDQFNKTQVPGFPNFSQIDPNSALRSMLKGKNILNMTSLVLSTANANGGILNIPFIQQNVDTTKMTSIFWVQEIERKGLLPNLHQLQYTQTIDLVFPATGTTEKIIWPHVTVNTLRRVKKS